uniref:Uncharacterized protein n=1 Tax=Oryza glumipatula TaxID=40148 RepID=A0A0E0BH92_9ORYZ
MVIHVITLPFSPLLSFRERQSGGRRVQGQRPAGEAGERRATAAGAQRRQLAGNTATRRPRRRCHRLRADAPAAIRFGMKQPRAAGVVRRDSTNDGRDSTNDGRDSSCSCMPRRPLCRRSSCACSAAPGERHWH